MHKHFYSKMSRLRQDLDSQLVALIQSRSTNFHCWGRSALRTLEFASTLILSSKFSRILSVSIVTAKKFYSIAPSSFNPHASYNNNSNRSNNDSNSSNNDSNNDSNNNSNNNSNSNDVDNKSKRSKVVLTSSG